MKFGQRFLENLRSKDYPAPWLQSAFPYRDLKKCIKRARQELNELGLDEAMIRDLSANHAFSTQGDTSGLVRYTLDTSKSELHPRFTIFINLGDGYPMTFPLTEASKNFLREQAAKLSAQQQSGRVEELPSTSDDDDDDSTEKPVIASDDDLQGGSETAQTAEPSSRTLETADADADADDQSQALVHRRKRKVELAFTSGEKFFDMIGTDIESLDGLEKREENSMTQQILTLGEQMTKLTKPRKRLFFFRVKNDISRWREVFELYVSAQIFFATTERDHGAKKTAEQARAKLSWFQEEVRKRQIVERFRSQDSRESYDIFIKLNASLLVFQSFQEWNSTALTKILKKFDKRTAFSVSSQFPLTLHSDFVAGAMSKNICAVLSQQLISIVPAMDDYTCPVCVGLAYLPVSLPCAHVFCVRCVIKLHRERRYTCPLCREMVIETAMEGDIDHKLEEFLKSYFPEESKAKQRLDNIERGKEELGIDNWEPKPCTIM